MLFKNRKVRRKNFTSNSKEKWILGKPRKIINGNNVCLIGTGPIIRLFFDILKNLNYKKIFPSIYSFHTLKPINQLEIKKIFKKYKFIFSIEDISEINGLSSILKEAAFDIKYKVLQKL